MLKAYGAHALYIEGLSIRTETVAKARGKRPWSPDRGSGKTTLAPARYEDGSERPFGLNPED